MNSDFFPSSSTNKTRMISCRGKLLDLSTPKVMGILNITNDSFYDGGKFTEEKAIIDHAGKMLSEGADIIDIGACTSRPGSKAVSQATELERLMPAIDGILQKFPETIISVDSFRSEVAEKCITAGASIINDISGGDLDNNMFSTIARLQVPYVLMHIKGTPVNMQENPEYDDVVSEVLASLGGKILKLRQAGVHDIIIDPGLGFGKTLLHNYRLLKSLSSFQMLDCPVLVGISRKSMICKALGINPKDALNGTTALHMTALMNGASILRAHDVKEAKEVISLFSEYARS
jgi:dihydropteroate synthase